MPGETCRLWVPVDEAERSTEPRRRSRQAWRCLATGRQSPCAWPADLGVASVSLLLGGKLVTDDVEDAFLGEVKGFDVGSV